MLLIPLAAPVVLAAAAYLVWDYRRTRERARSSALTLNRIQQAVESASDAIGIGDAEGNSVYHNRAHLALFGYTVDELNAQPGTGVLFADPRTAGEIHQSIRAGALVVGRGRYPHQGWPCGAVLRARRPDPR